MDLLTPLETICRLILRAKELEAQVPAEDPDDDPDDVDDMEESGEALSVLEDELNDGVEEEIQAVLDDLAEDQLAEVVALAWVGRGTYDVERMGRRVRGGEQPRQRAEDRRADGYAAARRPSRSGLAAFDYQLRRDRPGRLRAIRHGADGASSLASSDESRQSMDATGGTARFGSAPRGRPDSARRRAP